MEKNRPYSNNEFTDFYNEQVNRIRRLVAKKGILERDEEDAVQEIFQSFLKAAREGKVIRQTAPQYLTQIAVNHCKNRHTRPRYGLRGEEDANPMSFDRLAAPSNNRYVSAAKLDQIEDVLDRLDSPDREIAHAKFLDHHTVRQIAVQNKLSEKQVEYKLSKIRRRLRVELEELGVFDP